MRYPSLPLLGAAALGFATAALCFTAWSPRPANAQLAGIPGPVAPQPLGSINVGASALPAPPQPLVIDHLDGDHFVVATREPRLVVPINSRDSTAQNMLVTVVTHYTVRPDRLIPLEHVRVPTGYRLVTFEE
jgi:hypothetical protein